MICSVYFIFCIIFSNGTEVIAAKIKIPVDLTVKFYYFLLRERLFSHLKRKYFIPLQNPPEITSNVQWDSR